MSRYIRGARPHWPACALSAVRASTWPTCHEPGPGDAGIASWPLPDFASAGRRMTRPLRYTVRYWPQILKIATACHRLGVVAAQQGKLDEAIDSLTQAAELAPPSAELLNDLGYAHYLHNDLDSAKSYFRQALKKSPDYTPAWTNLGLALGQQQRDDEALMLRHARQRSQAAGQPGLCTRTAGGFGRGEADFRKALTLDPDCTMPPKDCCRVSSRTAGPRAAADICQPAERVENPPRPAGEAQPEFAADPPTSWNASQRSVGGDYWTDSSKESGQRPVRCAGLKRSHRTAFWRIGHQNGCD